MNDVDIFLEDIKEKLSTAGTTFDGHVTHGSLQAQLDVLKEALTPQLKFNSGNPRYLCPVCRVLGNYAD